LARAGAHLPGELAAILLTHLFCHRLGLLHRDQRQGSAEQRDQQVVALQWRFEPGGQTGHPVPLGRAARAALMGSIHEDVEVAPGSQLVEVMARHIRVEIELFSYLSGGYAVVVLSGEQVDMAAGRVTERARHRHHGGREFPVGQERMITVGRLGGQFAGRLAGRLARVG